MNNTTEYESTLPCNKLNMKYETLLLVGEFKDDYNLTDAEVDKVIQIMYKCIDTFVISNWNEYGMYLDDTFATVCPKVFEYFTYID